MDNIERDPERLKHLNSTLKKISENIWFEENSSDPVIVGTTNKFDILFIELFRIINYQPGILHNCILTMKWEDSEFTYEKLKETCSRISPNTNTKETYRFHFPLGHVMKKTISLETFSIRQLDDQEKENYYQELDQYLDRKEGIHRMEWEKSNIYVFETKSNSFDEVRERFNSVFHLYKGILEFSYNRMSIGHLSLGPIRNRKEFSGFKSPRYTYVKRENFYVDVLVHEDYPGNIDLNFTRNNEKNDDYFLGLLSFFTEDKLDKGMKNLYSDCFRLYGRGIDIPYMDQSFLFFWNVLERISLSESGNTEKVLKRVQSIVSNEFWEDSIYSLNYLRKIRNERVHKGKGDVTIFDINLLKHLCDKCLYFLFGDPLGSQTVITTLDHLESFYTIPEKSSLEETRKIIDLMIGQRNRLK